MSKPNMAKLEDLRAFIGNHLADIADVLNPRYKGNNLLDAQADKRRRRWYRDRIVLLFLMNFIMVWTQGFCAVNQVRKTKVGVVGVVRHVAIEDSPNYGDYKVVILEKNQLCAVDLIFRKSREPIVWSQHSLRNDIFWKSNESSFRELCWVCWQLQKPFICLRQCFSSMKYMRNDPYMNSRRSSKIGVPNVVPDRNILSKRDLLVFRNHNEGSLVSRELISRLVQPVRSGLVSQYHLTPLVASISYGKHEQQKREDGYEQANDGDGGIKEAEFCGYPERPAFYCAGSFFAYLFFAGIGFWLIQSAGSVEDVSVINLLKVSGGMLLILIAVIFAIHLGLSLCRFGGLL